MHLARSRTPEPRQAQLTLEQMRAALPKLDRRIADLEAFDVSVIQGRGNPHEAALVRKVDGTLQEILGHDTIEYLDYYVGSLDSLPISMMGDRHSLGEIQ